MCSPTALRHLNARAKDILAARRQVLSFFGHGAEAWLDRVSASVGRKTKGSGGGGG
jgi:hypothetical protein